MDMDDRDRISRLPDEFLLHILTLLPTKHAVATSSLSHRWNNLGISRSLRIFDFQTLDDQIWDTFSFVNFVNNLIRVNNSPTISKFRLKTHDFSRDYLSDVNEWIRFVISKSVTELDLDITFKRNLSLFYQDNCSQILRILPCDSLKILKISSNFDLDMPISGPTFGNLRILHLDFMESALYRELARKLFTDLPLLEELSIRATMWDPFELPMTFNIIAPALKILLFSTVCTYPYTNDVKVVIDAPLLEKICLVENFISSYSFKNCPNISEAKICVGKHRVAFFLEGNDYDASYYNLKAREILRAVSIAKSISLSGRAGLDLVLLPPIDLPLLPFLTKLELVVTHACAWKLLLPMLENSPNLKILVLTKMEYDYDFRHDVFRPLRQEHEYADFIGEFKYIPPEHLPTCLLLHIKEIEIRGVEKIEELKVLEFLIENAVVSNKFTVTVRSTEDEIVALTRFDGLQSFVM